MTAFDGNPATVEHLKYDVTNVVHYLRPSSDVVVVGTGGGRDILSALVFDQRGVTGVEINPSILELVNGRFGDFTGHLDRNPRVRFVNDEARSYLARMQERADIIQISLIDTWAATASGAFVLTENSLYTLEAWTQFLERLSPTRGALGLPLVLRRSTGRGLSQRGTRRRGAAGNRGQPAPGSFRDRARPSPRNGRRRPMASARSWSRGIRSRPPISTRSRPWPGG